MGFVVGVDGVDGVDGEKAFAYGLRCMVVDVVVVGVVMVVVGAMALRRLRRWGVVSVGDVDVGTKGAASALNLLS